MTPSPEQISELLDAWSNGDEGALNQLMPLVYRELHRMAHNRMAAQRSRHTLQTTVIIHELYLKLSASEGKKWQNRAHFFAVCSRAMRHIVVDYVRRRNAVKRGGDIIPITADEELLVAIDAQAVEVVRLNDAIEELAKLAPRQAEMVVLRYFGGLTVEETAEVLRVSPETVTRDWKLARAWLLRELRR